MSRPGIKPPTMGQALVLVQIVSTIANFNWKGLKTPMLALKKLWDSLNLKEYWGRLILVGLAVLLISACLYDWRRQAVERVEAEAALAVAVGQVRVLELKVNADEAARKERADILIALAKQNKEDIDDLQESVDASPDWANQRTPADVLARLR